MPSMWLVMAFDSSIRDERKYLKVDYGGFTFHIKPSMTEEANTIAVFTENDEKKAEAKLVINRFLSAMAWKDGEAYMLLAVLASVLPSRQSTGSLRLITIEQNAAFRAAS
jgi:hypothetical protein